MVDRYCGQCQWKQWKSARLSDWGMAEETEISGEPGAQGSASVSPSTPEDAGPATAAGQEAPVSSGLPKPGSASFWPHCQGFHQNINSRPSFRRKRAVRNSCMQQDWASRYKILRAVATISSLTDPLVVVGWWLFCLAFETDSHAVARLAVLKLTMQTKLALNSQRFSCLCLPGAGIKGMYYHTQPPLLYSQGAS